MQLRFILRVLAAPILALAFASTACSASAPPLASPPARSAAGDAHIRRMVLDAAASPETCERLRDRFVALPVKTGLSGASAGMAPAAGRWWIRGCSVASNGQTLRLHLAGPAWYRVDREQSGFSLHQYVYFDIDATMTGALDIGYDPAARLASIWFTPTDEAQVRLEPVGPLNLHADDFVDSLFTFLAEPVARADVVSEGETMLRNRLAGGVTLTVDLQHHAQVDLLLGQLPNGQAPRRPFTDGIPWVVNERLELFPGGLQVEGPFPSERTGVDAVVEAGPSVDYAFVCARDLQTAFNAIASGARPKLPANALLQRGVWLNGPVEHTLVLAPCPWYLVTATARHRAVAAIRVRKGRLVAGNSGSKVVRVTLISFRINATKPTGQAWDAFGGAPDPKISIGDKHVHYVVYNRMDTFQDSPTVAAPEPFEVTPGNPITIIAIDKDIMFDDWIGTATLRYGDLARGPELTLPLRLGGATTGYVHVRVEPAR